MLLTPPQIFFVCECVIERRRTMAEKPERYAFTVNSLLEFADRPRSSKPRCKSGYDSDHIVELQLVVAALNSLAKTIYSRKGWASELVDFFNEDANKMCIPQEDNRRWKRNAVAKLIRADEELTPGELEWIRYIQYHWNGFRNDLDDHDFKLVKSSIDDILPGA